ncbi:MAG: MerR family transcriptional regulator [Thermoleophilia bacterium]|jgi:DNA-binding transcriptional MerR regulator
MAEEARNSGQTSPASRPEKLWSIGQVVEQLRPDFPDLSITKLRYLEDRGLLTPLRTPGRYRKYGAADIRRLRTILTLQRDEYLPLDVIRQRVDRGAALGAGRPLDPMATPLRTGAVLKREKPIYSWDEAPEAAGVDADFFRILAEYRLVDRSGQSGPVLTESDLEIARICHLLAGFGVEPRNLRLLSSSVEREAALIEQVTMPSLRSTHPEKRAHGEKMLDDLGALLSQLLHLLLYKELRKLLV